MERCPKCQSIFIEWDGYNECFICLQKDCMHTWKEMELNEPIENVYLRITLPSYKKREILASMGK